MVISLFEVHADPICAVTTNCLLTCNLVDCFLCGGPNSECIPEFVIFKAAVLSVSYLFLL